MILELAYFGSPSLRRKCRPVEKIAGNIIELIGNMTETMIEKQGIGIAAPQVHRNEAIFITRVPLIEGAKYREDPIKVYVNPKIIGYSQKMEIWEEGCLSIPGVYLNIKRPSWVIIEAMDQEGNVFQEELKGLAACNFCHENDHLNGVLHIDRAEKKDKEKIKAQLLKIKKQFKQ